MAVPCACVGAHNQSACFFNLKVYKKRLGAGGGGEGDVQLILLAFATAYVVMIAGANQISAGSIGLVYLAAILPALGVKLSAPYWYASAEALSSTFTHSCK